MGKYLLKDTLVVNDITTSTPNYLIVYTDDGSTYYIDNDTDMVYDDDGYVCEDG